MSPEAGVQSLTRRLAEGGFTPAPDKPEETAEATARALWHAAAGRPRSAAAALDEPLPPLDDGGRERLESLLARRLGGEPLAYLTGRQRFLGLDFLTAPGALIPRAETELLGREAVRLLDADFGTHPAPRVLDLCTGCGNLAIAMAVKLPKAQLWAADLEHDALRVAAENARHHGVQERVRLCQGDLFGALAGEAVQVFEMITCNPPYLTTKHAKNMPREVGGSEPVAAFDGGPFGMSITLRLIREAPGHLVPGGWLCFELGAGQGPMLLKRLRDNPAWGEAHTVADEHGVIRALFARRRA